MSTGQGYCLARDAGIIFVIFPEGIAANPRTSSIDRKTLYSSSTGIFVGDIIVTLPLTLSSSKKFLPVTFETKFVTTFRSTPSKFIEIRSSALQIAHDNPAQNTNINISFLKLFKIALYMLRPAFFHFSQFPY